MAAGSWEEKIDSVLQKYEITKGPLQEDAAELLEVALTDYNDLAQQHGEMLKKYSQEVKPEYQNGVWCCPDCGSRIHYHHSHCHRCGKKIGWG